MRATVSIGFLALACLGPGWTFAQTPAPRLAITPSENAMLLSLPDMRGTNDCTIEASGDLKHWTSLGDMLHVNARTPFPDRERHGRRFYRAVWHGQNAQHSLDRNRGQWEAAGIPDYDFTFQWICFCVPDYVRPVVISVREDEITDVRPASGKGEIDPSTWTIYPTLDGLFAFLQDALDQEAHSLSAIFHPRLGYPREAFVDYNPLMADEERGFVVSDFRALRSEPEVQITDRAPETLPLDPFTLGDAVVEGNALILQVSHSGGCQEHAFELFMSPGAFLKSSPAQANLYLRHDGNNDLCEAWITRELRFDLRPIRDLHHELYGRTDPIRLNVFEFFRDTPDGSIAVDYAPR